MLDDLHHIYSRWPVLAPVPPSRFCPLKKKVICIFIKVNIANCWWKILWKMTAIRNYNLSVMGKFNVQSIMQWKQPVNFTLLIDFLWYQQKYVITSSLKSFLKRLFPLTQFKEFYGGICHHLSNNYVDL